MRRRDFLRTLGAVGVAGQVGVAPAIVSAAGQATSGERSAPPGRAHRAVWGRNGVVAAADQHASLAGVRMLMKGGNAVDATVAAAAALNVVEPNMSGMGGFGGFMMIYMASEGEVRALDMMGVSPKAASSDTMTDDDFGEGYKAPLVPGNLRGWAEALNRYGTMSLGDVFEPAIDLAERGFPVSEWDAAALASSAARLGRYPTSARIFLPDGRAPKAGWILRQTDLARTFRRVALHGAEIFYEGEIGDEIVSFLRQHGGLMARDELAGFRVRWREPIQSTYLGHTLYSMPPGSCGLTMFQILNIMEGFDVAGMDPYGVDFAHHWIEATKLALTDDDRYNTGRDVEIPVDRLMSRAYADEQRRRIHASRVSAFPGPLLPGFGTTHLSAADRWGNVVAFTQSNMGGYGSGVVAGNTGVVLNNGHRLGFVLEPGHVNFLEGGAHAKGIMVPTIVCRDGRPLLAVGAAGGYTIPQTVGQVITKVLAHGMDIQQAIASPRMAVNRSGSGPAEPLPGGGVPAGPDARTYLDTDFPEAVSAGLQRLGHTLTPPGNLGAVQGVAVDPESGALIGGSDPRRDGHPIAW